MRILSAALFTLLLLGLVEARPKASEEPPQLLTLQIDGGGETSVEIDKPFTVVIDGAPVKMKLIAHPHRILDTGEVRLHYPRNFTFVFKASDEEARRWTIEGPSTTLVLSRNHKADVARALEAAEVWFLKRFGPKTEARVVTLRVGDRVIDGRRFVIEVSRVTMFQDLYIFQAGGWTYRLMVHHRDLKDGKSAPETQAVLDLIQETLEIR